MNCGAKSIAGYEGLYTVDPSGVVRSARSGREISQQLTPRGKGYLNVSLWKENKGKRFYVHRLVALAFVRNPLEKETVNHIDGNTANNCASNLEWSTHKEQQDHAWSTGLSKHFGENGTNVKLKIGGVEEILRLSADGISQYEIARSVGVNQSQVSRIVSGKRWGRVTSINQERQEHDRNQG